MSKIKLAPQEQVLFDNLGKLTMAALFKKVWPRRNGVELREKAMRLGAVANRINRKLAVTDKGTGRKRKIISENGVMRLRTTKSATPRKKTTETGASPTA